MAKGGFFNAYFYGKSGKKDYTEADLPRTRFELFATVLSVRRSSMLGLNLLYLLFWLPALFWSFLSLIQIDVSSASSLYSIVFSWLVVMVPLIALTGPFNMGISCVMRSWARDEHSFAWADFWAGVKANWKSGLLFGLINGLFPMLTCLCLGFYGQLLSLSPLFYLAAAAVIGVYLLWNMCAMILPTVIAGYELSFFAALKNAVLMSLASLPKTFGALLLTLIPPIAAVAVLAVFPAAVSWLPAVLLLYYSLFGLSLNKLIAASHANALCEKYLNTKIHGARVNIGLRSVSETNLSSTDPEEENA